MADELILEAPKTVLDSLGQMRPVAACVSAGQLVKLLLSFCVRAR